MLVGFFLSYWLGYYLTLSSLQVFASSCCILIYDGVSSSEAWFCSVVLLVLARAGVFPCIFGYLTVYHSLSENYVWRTLGDSSLHQRMCLFLPNISARSTLGNITDANRAANPSQSQPAPASFQVHLFLSLVCAPLSVQNIPAIFWVTLTQPMVQWDLSC
uniref:Uncharacterized protein n=1 Tax=Myotis myotis TaxID=51298 RepID=A0A7J7R966_MYOMY|nr:hypothetical protein mMyoMyo1_010873 [Myotis myotis]